MEITKSFALGGLASTLMVMASPVYAAPLPNGTKLTIAPGTVSNNQCVSGSCFGWDTAPNFTVWAPLVPGLDGGFVIGKNQNSGGQEAQSGGLISNPGELTAAYLWLGVYGTFATKPLTGVFGAVTTDASQNLFDSASCSGAGCAGKTQLGTWHEVWNGNVTPFGSAGGCKSASTQYCIGVSNWTVNPDGTHRLDYTWISPDGDPSGLGGVPMRVHLEGAIVPTTWPDISGTWLASGVPVLFIFGERFASVPQDNQITVNGISIPNFQLMDSRLLLVLLPGSVVAPFTVTVTTPDGTASFPKSCTP